MGLNWSEGLKQAGSGLEGLAKHKMVEADYIYREVSQRNRERFQAGESQKQRDFLSAEKETQRDWEAPYKERGLDIQERGTELSGELKLLAQESLDTQRSIENRLREQSNQIQGQRAESASAVAEKKTGIEAAKLTAEQFDTQIKRVEEEIEKNDATLNNIVKSDEERAEAKAANDALKQDIAELDRLKSQRMEYDQLDDNLKPLYDQKIQEFGTSAGGHDVSMKYSKLNEEQRGQVDALRDHLLKEDPNKFPNKKAAEAGAIGLISSGENPLIKKEAAKTPAGSVQADNVVQEEPINSPQMPPTRQAGGRRGEREVPQYSLKGTDKKDWSKDKADWVEARMKQLAIESGDAWSWTGNRVTSNYDQLLAQAEKEWNEKFNFIQEGSAQVAASSP